MSSPDQIPPKPIPRDRRVSLWRYMRLFRRDILSAQPAHLYRAWMAEFRTPFFHSFLVNDPAVIREVLNERPMDFPKSGSRRGRAAPVAWKLGIPDQRRDLATPAPDHRSSV